MKNSGVQWIGDIPQDWSLSRIKYIANYEANSFCDGDWIESPYIIESGIRYLTSGNIGDGKFKRQGNGYISDITFRLLGCKFAYPGDLIFSRLNAPFGRSCILPDDEERYVIAVDNVILRTNQDKRYICYFTQTIQYQQYIEQLCNGMAMQRIGRKKMGDCSIPLPPLPEQKAIADFLDTKCEEIDALLQDLDAEVKTLAEYKKSIIAETVTKGLNHNVPMKSSGIPWIGDIPSHWSISKMQYIAEYLNGYAFKPSDWSEKGLPIIRIQDLTGSNDNPNYFDGLLPERYRVRRGDILISWAATLNSFIWEKEDAWLNQHIFKTQYYKDIVTKNFFFWLTQVVMLNMNNANKHGIMMQHVTTNVFNKFSLPLPPLTEQKAIADYLDKKCAAIEQIITSKLQQIETLKAYKSSLIYEYVTGKKQVPV